MKEKPKKQFTELSDQELEKVTGGTPIAIKACGEVFTNPCGPGMMPDALNNCQCVPKPNTILR